jgi:Fe-S-cluster containining protein
MISDRSIVPCNGCTACCKTDAVLLLPEDNVESYLHEAVDIPGVGPALILAKVDGHCVYLVDELCTIWHRAPKVCKAFDCRRFFLSRSRSERRRMVKEGIGSQEVMKAGQARVDTLTPAERADSGAMREELRLADRDGRRHRIGAVR